MISETSPAERAPSGKGRILCFGDSNTYGYDPRSWLGAQYPPDVRWTGLLQAAGWDVLNCGQNGWSIPRESQYAAVAALFRSCLPLEAVTVMLGSNDLLQEPSLSAEDVTARMEPFLRFVLGSVDGARMILIAPPPMQPGEWVLDDRLPECSARLGVCYQALAQKLGILFADAGAWDIALAFDGVHFLPDGHAVFARELLAVLSSV